MKITHFCLGVLLPLLLTTNSLSAEEFGLPELAKTEETAPATAAEDDSSGLEEILSGEEKIPLLSEAELEDHLSDDWQAVKQWFHKEAPALRLMLLGTLGTLLVGSGIGWGLHRWRKARAAKPNPSLRAQLFFALAEPFLLILVIMTIFGFLLPVLQTLPDFYTIDARIFFTLIMIALAWAGMRLISVFNLRMHAYAKRADSNLDALMVDITRKVSKIVLIAFTALFIGQNIFSLNITTLLAGAGVVGLAIAFASRETLSNFFGTLVIILDRPFRCGDRIQVGGIDGIVDCVGMRSTRILTPRESLYTIPNSQIAASNIENISSRGVIRFLFTVGMVYETTADEMEKTMRILHAIVDNFHGPDPAHYTPRIFFESFGNSSMNITVIMWLKTSSYATEERWRTEINLAVLRELNKANLSMAYNTITNVIQGDPGHPLLISTSRTTRPGVDPAPVTTESQQVTPATRRTSKAAPSEAPPPQLSGTGSADETGGN